MYSQELSLLTNDWTLTRALPYRDQPDADTKSGRTNVSVFVQPFPDKTPTKGARSCCSAIPVVCALLGYKFQQHPYFSSSGVDVPGADITVETPQQTPPSVPVRPQARYGRA